MKRNRRPWPTQDRKRELAEKAALWERYAVARAAAQEASLRALEVGRDPNATEEEKEAARSEARAAGRRRIEAYPDRVRREKEITP